MHQPLTEEGSNQNPVIIQSRTNTWFLYLIHLLAHLKLLKSLRMMNLSGTVKQLKPFYIKKIAAERYTNQNIVDPIFYLLLFFVIHNYKSVNFSNRFALLKNETLKILLRNRSLNKISSRSQHTPYLFW